MPFDRYCRSSTTGWKRGRDFPQLANALQRQLDAVVFGDLFSHRFHLGIRPIPHPVLSGFRTLSQYRVSEGPFAAFPLPDGRIATRKFYNRSGGGNLLVAGGLVSAGIRPAFPRAGGPHTFASEAIGRGHR